MSRGVDFVILKNLWRLKHPNGMEVRIGPRGKSGKTNCARGSLKCVSDFFANPYPTNAPILYDFLSRPNLGPKVNIN